MIGARARSWPIRDGKDQARLVASTAAAALPSSGNKAPARTAFNDDGDLPEPIRSGNGARARNNTNVTRDPHSSLALFSSPEEIETEKAAQPSKPPSRGSAGPPPRYVRSSAAGVPVALTCCRLTQNY